MRTWTWAAVAALALLGGVAMAVFLGTEEPSPDAASAAPIPDTVVAARKSRIASETAPDRAGHVIAGRVTGIPPGVTARVEARRLGGGWESDVQLLAAGSFDPPPAAPAADAAAVRPDGSFELRVSAAGRYLVSAGLSDGREAWGEVEVPEQVPRAEIELAAPVGAHSLRGRVVRADGAPFRGWIKLGEWGEAAGLRPSRWVPAGADGRFEFRGIAGISCQVDAVLPGEAIVSSGEVPMPHTDDLVITVGAGPLNAGRVVADADGSPIAGARVVVRIAGEDASETRLTTTGADGAFSFHGDVVPFVHAEAPGFGPEAIAPEEDAEIVVRLRRCGAITGRVLRSSDGSPAEGAVVRTNVVSGWQRPQSATSAADGSYRLENLPPQQTLVYVLGGGWASVRLVKWWVGTPSNDNSNPFEVDVQPTGVETYDLFVEPAARITGRVLGPPGGPVRAARVDLQLDENDDGGPEFGANRTAWTSADGTFEFADLPSATDFRIDAVAAGFASSGTNGTLAAGETQTIDIQFAVPQRLEVTVLAASTGAPVPKADIAIYEMADGGGYSGLVSDPHATDVHGRCVIPDAPPGRLGVSARARGFVRLPDSEPVAAAQDATDPRVWRVEVRLQPGFAVAGKVLHADDSPVAEFSLALKTRRDPDDSYLSSVGENADTGDDGTFRFEDVPAGSYLLCQWSGEEPYATVVAGDEQVVVRLAAEETAKTAFELTFAGPDGAPVPKGGVDIVFAEGGGRGEWFKDGKLVVTSRSYEKGDIVVAVSYAADAEDNALALGAATFVFSAPLPEAIELRFPPERVVTGRVAGPDGRGIAGVVLRVRFDDPRFDDPVATATSSDDGSFEIRRLGDGAFLLDVKPPKDFVPPPAPIPIRGGQTDLVVTLTASAGGVVTVTDGDGRPVRGAFLVVRGPAAGDQMKREEIGHFVTGADGSARVNGIVPGTQCVLSVTGPANRDDLVPWSAEPWTPGDTKIRLERAFAVRGVVLDGDGRPEPYSKVFVAKAADWEELAVDDSGHFAIAGLPRGATRRIRALAYEEQIGEPDTAGWTTVTAGEIDVRLHVVRAK